MMLENAGARLARGMVSLLLLGAVATLLSGCGKDDKKDVARPPLEVTALTIVPRDVPVTSVFVAQTQSSQAVNIAARVSGFLDKRVYTEGAVVEGRDRCCSRWTRSRSRRRSTARPPRCSAIRRRSRSLRRTSTGPSRSPKQNALSQKDLDDAQGQYEQAQAAVAQGKAQLEEAKLEPLVHDDHLARRRRLELRRPWPTARTSIRRTASSPPSRC